MAHCVVTQQACGRGITHVLCHLKTKLGLSAIVASALHFRESGFLFLFDPDEQAVAQLPLYLSVEGAVLVDPEHP
jgi:hypothetical protein